MRKLTVQVEDELLVRLQLVALKEQKKLSEIVRGLISAYVARKEGESV